MINKFQGELKTRELAHLIIHPRAYCKQKQKKKVLPHETFMG
jgi:hypothetical protein